MSKTYEVRLGIEEVEESAHRKLLCPPIVPEIGEMLGDELASAGWTVARGKATKTVQTKAGTVTARVSLDDPSLEITAKASGEVIGRSYDAADDDVRGKAAARRDGESKRASVREKLRKSVGGAVAEAEIEIRGEVQAAVQAAVRAAVLKKAASMGTVESVTDGQDAKGRATTTIVIEV